MSDEDQDSKTELPTDKHLSEAHNQGNFAKAPEIAVVTGLVAALGAISMSLGTVTREITSYATNVFSHLALGKREITTVPVEFQDGLLVVGKTLSPVLGAAVLAALISGGVQSGFRITPEVLGFKIERLNPMAGLQRIFSKQVLTHALVDGMKMVAIGFILWVAAQALFEDPMFTTPVEAAYLGRFYQTATYAFLSRVILALGVVAAASYAFEFFRVKKSLMMTKEQVKEEHKQAEGDMKTKAAMRRMARRLMQKQMMAAVPTADVVVVNPTHFAVALRYERGRDQAPIILAKGQDRFALRLKAIAAEHGVPIVENKPVARMLCAMGEVGETIPDQLFQVVAEILAVVYRTHRYYFHQLKTRRAEAERLTASRVRG